MAVTQQDQSREESMQYTDIIVTMKGKRPKPPEMQIFSASLEAHTEGVQKLLATGLTQQNLGTILNGCKADTIDAALDGLTSKETIAAIATLLPRDGKAYTLLTPANLSNLVKGSKAEAGTVLQDLAQDECIQAITTSIELFRSGSTLAGMLSGSNTHTPNMLRELAAQKDALQTIYEGGELAELYNKVNLMPKKENPVEGLKAIITEIQSTITQGTTIPAGSAPKLAEQSFEANKSERLQR
jgi:uncharacterized protein YukE